MLSFKSILFLIAIGLQILSMALPYQKIDLIIICFFSGTFISYMAKKL